jgi:hypothetical protein
MSVLFHTHLCGVAKWASRYEASIQRMLADALIELLLSLDSLAA